MSKGSYIGGSTIIQAFPPTSGRKFRKSAIDAWIEGAKANSVLMPDDISLRPISSAKADLERKNKKGKKRKKKSRAKKERAKRPISTASAKMNSVSEKPMKREVNAPLPEFAELVYALREKYTK